MTTYYHEKLIFTAAAVISSGIMYIGAIMTTGDSQWLFATGSVSVLVSAFLSLTFRRSSESIRVVIGRCGITILLSVFGTRFVVYYCKLAEVTKDDMMMLGAITMAVCLAAYFPGHSMIRGLDRQSNSIGQSLFALIFRILNVPYTPPSKKGESKTDDTAPPP
jgi:hypothetical protein